MATMQQGGTDLTAPSALRRALAQIVRRLSLARRLRLASRGGLVATGLSLLAVGCAHGGLLPVWLPLELAIPLLLLLGVGLGALLALRHPIDPMAAARLAEARLGLKERFSSALEFERTGRVPSDPEAALLQRLQGQDAAAHALALRPADVVPIRLPWEAKAFLAAFLVLLLALVLPALPVFVPPSVRAERAVVQKSGQELARVARTLEKQADAQRLPATKHAAQTMQKLGRQMAQGRMDKKQAMVQMSRLSKQMAAEQRRLAQAGGTAGRDGKSLEQAGRQLAQSLSQSPSGPDAKSPHGTVDKGSTPQSANTPGRGAAKPGSTNAPGQTKSATPDVQNAAQALKQGSTSGLSEQLRNLAQRTASHPMSPDEQRQAAQDLQKLSDALKDTPLSESQKHAQAAADAMKRGDAQRAAEEMRQAADAADRQAKPPQDAQGVRDAQNSLQANQQQMARAATPTDITRNPSGQPPDGGKSGPANPPGQGKPRQSRPGGAGKASGHGQSQGKSGAAGQNNPGATPQAGAPGNSRGGGGKSLPATGPGQFSHEGGQTPSHDAGVVRGAPHPLDPKFDPAKNPKYGKIFLGAGDGGYGAGGKWLPLQPGISPSGEPHAGSVPYYNSLAPARKTAETAMDREDIPPAYRSSVRRYFDALQPPAGKPSK